MSLKTKTKSKFCHSGKMNPDEDLAQICRTRIIRDNGLNRNLIYIAPLFLLKYPNTWIDHTFAKLIEGFFDIKSAGS